MTASWMSTAALSFVLALSPIVVLTLVRGAIGPLNAAAWIASWGLLIPAVEHGYWGIDGSRDALAVSDHAQVHMVMGLAYWPLSALALAVVLGILLREGRREAWFVLLALLAVGGGLEIILNGPAGLVFQHGVARDSQPSGLALLAYPVAWVVALVLSYRPIFRAGVARR